MPVVQSSEPRHELEIRALAEPRGIWLGTIVALPGFILLALQLVSSALAAVLAGSAFFAAVLVFARWSMRHMTTRHLTVRAGRLTDRLPAALGVTEEVRAGQTTAKRLRREVPGAVPRGEAHVVLSTVLFLAVVCAIVAALQSL